MRAVVFAIVVLCVGPAQCRLCQTGTFWDDSWESCLPCSVCTDGQMIALPCRPSHDTVCEPVHHQPLPPPMTSEQVHRNRLAEERMRADLEQAAHSMEVERTQLETLVFEWQTAVLVVSFLVTFALAGSFMALLWRRSHTVIRKGVSDYSHLILNREDEHRDTGDQSSLAYADFHKIKIGRRPFDSPYSDLSIPRSGSTRASTTCVANVNSLPRQQV